MATYDALVIGGGPAGSAAALMLARAGWKVVLAEKSQFPRRKVCGEFISPAGIAVLHKLGVGSSFLSLAGPPIRRFALYTGAATLEAEMPAAYASTERYGRALGRERLDTLLLAAAAQAGARVMQPAKVIGFERNSAGRYRCTIAAEERITLEARHIIAAHGSWERSTLPTQPSRCAPSDADLFAFKAHFKGGSLPPDLMPLLTFAGGYGGMVHTDEERISLSCCIRRDALAHCRREFRSATAGASVFAHIKAHCAPASRVLTKAEVDGEWLASGPIRPGIRLSHPAQVFAVGNAAGEAHPIVAEGISMALQSSVLICDRLVGQGPADAGSGTTQEYAIAWRSNFAERIRAAAVYAYLAQRPAIAHASLNVMRRFPVFLSLGVRMAGKVRPLREPAAMHVE